MKQLIKQVRYSTEAHQDKKKMIVKAGEQTRSDVEYSGTAAEKTKEAVKAPAEKTYNITSDETYKDVLAFSETGEISLLRNKCEHRMYGFMKKE